MSPDSRQSEEKSTVSLRKRPGRAGKLASHKNMDSIAEVAAGPTEDSIFVPKKLDNSLASKLSTNVNSNSYRLEPLALKDNKALEFLEYYYQKIDRTMRKSFGTPAQVLLDARNGLKPTWISIRQGSKDSGLLIYNMDPHEENKPRLNILNMSITNREGLEESVRLCLEYIWNHSKAVEIRIGLHHYEGTTIDKVTKLEKKCLKVDEEYKSLLKRFNFKWR